MQEFSKRGRLGPYRLNSADLEKLEAIIVDGFSQKEAISFSARFKESSISAKDAKEFVNHEDLPDRITEDYSVYASEYRDKARKAIFLGDDTLTVEGPDQAWVLGKFAQISEFFKKRRPRFSSLISLCNSGWIVGSLLVMVGIITTSVSMPIVNSLFITTVIMSSSVGTGAFFLMLAIIQWRLIPMNAIIIRTGNSSLSKSNILLIAAIGTFITTVIGLVIEILPKIKV